MPKEKNEDKALDAVQECITKGFVSIVNLRNPEYFKTWLTKILINELLHTYKEQAQVIPYEKLDIPQKEDGLSIEENLMKYGSIAAGFILIFCTLTSNPVLASKIPFIGKIFSQVENQVTFSGNYSSKSKTIMNTSESQTNLAKKSASDKGIKIDVSEVFCDGSSAYLTLNLESKESFGQIEKYFSTADGKNSTKFMYLEGTWSIGKNGIISPILTPYELKVNASEKTLREDYGVAVYNQDGVRLPFEKQYGRNTMVYPIQKKNVTSVEIFVCKNFIETAKCKDKAKLEKRSILHKVVQFQTK